MSLLDRFCGVCPFSSYKSTLLTTSFPNIQSESQTTDKLTPQTRWRTASQSGTDDPFNLSEREIDPAKTVFTVSAAIHPPSSPSAPRTRQIPYYGCPRRYSDSPLSESDDIVYVHERFAEAD